MGTCPRSFDVLSAEDLDLSEKKESRVLGTLERLEREQRFRRVRSEDFQVIEEVFDKPTLLAANELINTGAFKYLNGVVSSGKEARVYWGVRDEGSDAAVKIYLVTSAIFKRRLPYIVGDPRFKKIKRSGSGMIEQWVRKEHKNLSTAFSAGIRVPEIIDYKRNILVMEFIGEHGKPAPILAKVEVSGKLYRSIISCIRKLYQGAGLVHADLSEYNVFLNKSELVYFDFGSAVSVDHPLAKDFLTRDVININRFFSSRGVSVRSTDRLVDEVMGN